MALSSGPWDGEIISWVIWIGSKLNHIYPMRGFPGGSVVKNPPAKQEIQVRSRGQEDPLEEEIATYSSIPAWGNPWTEEPGGLQSMGLQRGGHDLATEPPPPSLWRGGAEGYLIHRYINRCSTSQVIRKMQMKTTMRYHLTQLYHLTMSIIKRQQITNASMNVHIWWDCKLVLSL